MKTLNELVPNLQTMYHLSNTGLYRLHNDHAGGLMITNLAKALNQNQYEYIDAFPVTGGRCILTVKYNVELGIWYDTDQLEKGRDSTER